DQKKTQANKSKKVPTADSFNSKPKRLSSLFSSSSSAHDLRHLELEKEKEDITSPRGVLEACMKDGDSLQPPVPEITCSTSRPHSHWTKFFKLLKRKSSKRLGSLPSLSVPKIPKWKSKSSRENQVLSSLCNLRSSLVTFSLSNLRNATNNFSNENIIGRGGFAEVYKGCLQGGQLIAVKKLTTGTAEEKTAGFLSELGIIAHVDHANTAKLVGCCIEGEMHLVFELSPLGSLGSLLHGPDKSKLDWSKRYKIAQGIADGLLYLHESCHRRIIHRDIKSENILLTENFVPQICDFGLAKWLPEQLTHHNVSKFEGTFGYFAPEYFMHGIVDEKTDVYSFGVLLLEIITGRPAVNHLQQSVVTWAKPLLDIKYIKDLVDPSLGNNYDKEQLGCVVTLLRGDEYVLESTKASRRKPLQRTFSEELLDAQEYNSTKYLGDLMRHKQNQSKDNGRNKSNGFVPSSFKFISSCIKTASSGVRSAGASVAASISGDGHDGKDQVAFCVSATLPELSVLWACFDRLELNPSSFKHVLLLGYSNGFQVLDVEDASNVRELVSKRDDPVSFLQMQPVPAKSEGCEGFKASHPLLLVVACDKSKIPGKMLNVRDGHNEAQVENIVSSATAVRFYSLRSHTYVHALRFRSTVYMVRCSPRIVAVGLATQIYCFDALTLENKFSVLTYPVPQLGGQGMIGVNIGYGPMAVGPRWLAYASNSPLLSNAGRLSPQSLTPPSVSPSTSPSSGSLVARYAMESSKHLAAGLINLSDIGYKTLSKYYQDLIPDGSSSPVSSNSSWKVSRFTSNSTETDTAGMVVVRDFVSRAVVAQFRAHTSPISALCFDPSGTLLVTASIHGNNINIFRIMPSCSRNGSGSQSNDWSCSHVHLFKLHRGMTSAVIQDICFSHYSQWVAIISSKGTCHIFVLAPFGGETVLKMHNQDTDGPALLPIFPLPWWFTPRFTVNQQQLCLAPPPPVVLSVVSRIKNSNAGWLNTVSNAASSAAGKVSIPSGAVSAVFHSSIPHDSHNTHSKIHAMEHLLVYTPSGHLIQYKLLPSLVVESSETTSRTAPVPSAQIQEEDLRVKVEPVQWWDACRRYDWPEKEVCILGNTVGGLEAAEMILDYEDNSTGNSNSLKLNKQCHFSNTEVHISSGRIPIWQESKVSFFVMSPLEAGELNLCELSTSGEIEIENFPVNEIEIKQKDLLPIFDHFHRIQSTWGDRGIFMGRCSSSSSDSHGTEEKLPEDAAISHSKFMVPGLAEKAYVGASNIADIITAKAKSSKHEKGSDSFNSTFSGCDLNMNVTCEESIRVSPDFEQFFQEGYCKASVDCHESTEVITDVDCSSPCGREKSDEDGDNDDMLGDVFDFSEEGMNFKITLFPVTFLPP
ncbi:Autophagy-related protein 18h, partial [Mucuna pruriens]